MFRFKEVLPHMKVLVTAFGPFDGRLKNASSLALYELKRKVSDLKTRILPVDAVVAPARLKQALRQLRPDALIMLGEAVGSGQIRLETTAWNELDFAIPDLAGRQPRGKKIIRDAADVYHSTLPLQSIFVKLQEQHQVCLSDDAGRYLCNQLFYVALAHLKKSSMSCLAGFIHLPLAQDYPTEQAAAAVAEVISLLRPSSFPYCD
jgi:pyroglutamyl-peptidase